MLEVMPKHSQQSLRQRGVQFVAPSREDVGGHGVGFFAINVLSDRLRCRKPGGSGYFADVVMFRCPEKCTQVHGELIAVAVVVGKGFGADFKGRAVDLERADDLGCVEQGVDHDEERSRAGAACRWDYN